MRDAILEFVVTCAEMNEPLELPITLIVGGLLVTGHVVSKDCFMDNNSPTSWLKKALESRQDDTDGAEQVKAEDDGARRFIHLRDARYFAPGQPPIPTEGSVSCRVKIADVSGFHFGYISTSPEG